MNGAQTDSHENINAGLTGWKADYLGFKSVPDLDFGTHPVPNTSQTYLFPNRAGYQYNTITMTDTREHDSDGNPTDSNKGLYGPYTITAKLTPFTGASDGQTGLQHAYINFSDQLNAHIKMLPNPSTNTTSIAANSGPVALFQHDNSVEQPMDMIFGINSLSGIVLHLPGNEGDNASSQPYHATLTYALDERPQ